MVVRDLCVLRSYFLRRILVFGVGSGEDGVGVLVVFLWTKICVFGDGEMR